MHGSRIIPGLRYKDAYAAIEWLCRVFGMTKQAVYEGPNGTVAHAQLTLGQGMLMLGSEVASQERASDRWWVGMEETGGRETMSACLIMTDAECEATYERVKAEGVEIVQELHEPEYGGKAFGCRDLEQRVWWVGSYDPWV